MKKMTKFLLAIVLVLTAIFSLSSIASAAQNAVWLEAEEGTITGEGLDVKSNGAASGGKGLHIYKSDLTPASVTMSFNVAEAGNYDVNILSLEYRDHTTKYGWYIDSNSPARLSRSSRPSVYSHSIAGSSLPVQWHDAGTVYLSKGAHTLTLTADKARGVASNILTYFDAVSISPSSWNWEPDGINKPSKYKVTSFTLKGGIIPGEKITASATVADTSGLNDNMMLALAFYKGNMLAAVKTDIKGCGDNPNYLAELNVPEDDEITLVKAFLWDAGLTGSSIVRKTEEDLLDFVINIEEDREPVILHISDPQIIDATQERYSGRLGGDVKPYWGGLEKIEQNCFNYIKEAVDASKPDLILITGDIIYGEFDDNGNALKEFIRLMETLDIPWAPIFGNHENESKMGADWQCEQFEAAENCLFKQRTLTGNGNYNIGIKQNGKLNRVIFMLDSNGCGAISEESLANGHSTAGVGFGADQIAWYTETAEGIKAYNENVKFTFAYHIQPQMFATAYEKYGFSNGVPIIIDYLANKADTDFGIIGAKLKGAWDSNGNVTNGMIALGADSILVGHEHANSASVVYEGVRYQYGQKCSVYDRNNYVAQDGSITYASYPDAGDPIMGGTVMKMSKTDGSFTDAYIYYCDTSDDAGAGGGVYDPYNPPKEPEVVEVAGLGFSDGSLSLQSGMSYKTATIAGHNAYQFTANSQSKIYINTELVKNKSTFSFDVYIPSSSTAELGGALGAFAMRAKPNDLGPNGPGYFAIPSTKFTYDAWSTITIDISKFGTTCTEFAFNLPAGMVMYVKNIAISGDEGTDNEEDPNAETDADGSIAGLGVDDGSITYQSQISVAKKKIAGANAYKFTANSQGKVYVDKNLLKNKSTISFDVYVPSTSTKTLGGYAGDFAIRVKPESLCSGLGISGYISYFESNSVPSRSFTFDTWTPLSVDISGYGESCTEFAFVVATSNVLYIKNIVIK